MKTPIILFCVLLFALGVGVGAGVFLRPAPHETLAEAGDAGPEDAEVSAAVEYVKLNNQFIIPVLEGDRVASLVAMSLSLEVKSGSSEQVFAREPKLRDVFLRALFAHANTGGFRGSFTDSANLVQLRRTLLEEAQKVIGDSVIDILITEIARQDS